MGVVGVTWPFLNFGPNHIFGISEARHCKCRVLIQSH